MALTRFLSWGGTVALASFLIQGGTGRASEAEETSSVIPLSAPSAGGSLIEELREMRRMLDEQNRVIERLQRRLDEKESGSRPALVPVIQPAGSSDPENTVDAELDARITAALTRIQAKGQSAPAQEYEVGKDLDFKMSWQHGLVAETADKAFKVHVGGRTQFDPVWFTADEEVEEGAGGTGRIEDAVNFRRARLAIEGTMFEVIEFNCEYDFLNTFDADPGATRAPVNTPAPTDLWVTVTQLPIVGNVRVGNQKPPISFEHMTSSRYLNFLERSFSFDAFIGGLDNGFRPGIQMFNTFMDDRATWALGYFKNNSSVFGWNVGDGEGDVTGRLTYLPWVSNDGRCLIHVGLGGSHRDLDDEQARFRARTHLRNGPGVLHTVLAESRMLGDNQDLLVPEFAMVWGPWTFQAEYYATWVHDASAPLAAPVDVGTAFFNGYYVEALYFITGENRAYDRKYPRFSRVVPNENFFYVGSEHGPIFGRGAWQVGARYSFIDLNDSGINGGELDDVTLGLNWFFNPNLKLQWNYSATWRDVVANTSDGVVQGVGMRVAYDF